MLEIGGMATVYKAKCHVLNRYVAVKVLRDEFTTDEEFVKRFNTEAQSAASLTHPNIVSVYDVGSEGDTHYIVMELIKGKTLKEIINEDGAISWKWSVNVAIQIASALETAHKNNIVHRDIKPHNIIITEDGIAKVTDFGIAKAVSNSTITAFGSTIGSVHYFSPEHARGGFTDPKSDLYSLGVVLYEMVTGKVPFSADTPVSVALKHMQEKPIEPIEINPDIPKSVNSIIMKAMQKDINLRYQTATEMLRDLSKAIKNPNDDFVVVENMEATQRLSTIYDKSEVREEKREKGLKGFIKRHKGLCITFGAIILFVITILATNLILNLTAKKDIQIINLVGKEQSQAIYEAEQLKLNVVVGNEQFNKEVPAGCIISQEPAYMENYLIKEGTTITVVISKGRNLVIVPKVMGKTKDEAVAELEELGLLVNIEEEYNKKVEAGYVIEQSVKEKEEIDAGETINLKVSKGIEMTIVPDLNGKTEDEAKTLIKEAGLKV
ncbi:MAG: Stk1 family PASTA domain-containing Ser/Thr kinase, partial [Clostridia bacterium]|nr:Stk1 family PASTA domain-containing Ser/Thr kinase [Clostridia bacterium]